MPPRLAWQQVATRLRPFVARRIPNATDVDDVLQEIFLRAERGISGLANDELFGPWLFKIARSAIADYWRVRVRHPVSGEASDACEIANDDVDEIPFETELAQYVAPLVALLPSPYREALTLTELEAVNHKDAAEMLGISLTAMKSRVQRGRARLRALFDSSCEFVRDARGRVIDCSPKVKGKDPCRGGE